MKRRFSDEQITGMIREYEAVVCPHRVVRFNC